MAGYQRPITPLISRPREIDPITGRTKLPPRAYTQVDADASARAFQEQQRALIPKMPLTAAMGGADGMIDGFDGMLPMAAMRSRMASRRSAQANGLNQRMSRGAPFQPAFV